MVVELNRFEPQKNRGEAVFLQLAGFIRESIDSGVLMPGEKLPTEREIAEKTELARGTVRNAFRVLEQEGLIRTRRGSGSYVSGSTEIGTDSQRSEAMRIINSAIDAMTELDMRDDEIGTLFNYCLTSRSCDKNVSIAVVAKCQESLLDIKRQLSYLEGVSVSVFIFESLTTAPEPKKMLEGYALIISPESCFETLAALAPELRGRMIEAALSPSPETLQQLVPLDRNARFGIICRTNIFLAAVKETLKTFGFKEENIQSFFEMDYTVQTYFPGGIDALISFHDAHVFTYDGFRRRNAELLAKGGKLIRYTTSLQRGTLIYIEDRVNALVQGK